MVFIVAVVESRDVGVERSMVAQPGMIINIVNAYALVGVYLQHATNQVGGHWVQTCRNMVLTF